MNKTKILLSGLLLTSASAMYGQGANNIRINEVLTNNTASIQDEYGQREAWIELENTSFTTYTQRHPGKFPKVPGRRRGKRGFPAATRERHRESFFNAS